MFKQFRVKRKIVSCVFVVCFGGGCDMPPDASEEFQEPAVSAMQEDQESERSAFIDNQRENEALGDWEAIDAVVAAPNPAAGPEDPPHVNVASGTIHHGGVAFEEAKKFHIVGSLCSPGRIRAGYSVSHQGHGWGGFERWLSPTNIKDCQAVLWTRNSGGFVYGDLFYTIEEEDSVPGHYDYCEAFGPCGAGQGDCDDDSECAPGLTCQNDVGGEHGWVSGIDVCTAALPNGHYDYCKIMGPCEAGEGDCDGDSECLPPWSCGNNNGPDHGFEPWTDVCH